jgi:hypothetical protein
MDGDSEVFKQDDSFQNFTAEVDLLIERARTLDKYDPKLEAFIGIIRGKQDLGNNKLLVFSTFRHTLSYLLEALLRESIRVGIIHGDVPDYERREIRRRFSMEKNDPNALDVLLSSEVGCEGLDFQFCDVLVNYDLPWNPMRVEQRIGRIDRYGQKSEKVLIYNLITPGTVDFEIYDRCLMRIGVFNKALGGSEEVLGRITREIRSIAESISLTDQEKNERLQQLADNEIRFIQEQAKLEKQQENLFGLNLPKQNDELLKTASSFWISPVMLANLIERYISKLDPAKSSIKLGQKSITTLQCSKELRERLLIDYEKLGLTGAVAHDWRRWLKGNEPNLLITFDPQIASDRRDVSFITPTHPLSKQAAESMEPSSALTTYSEVYAKDIVEGTYPYAIYRWKKIGIKEDFTFQLVCNDDTMADRILTLLELATTAKNSEPVPKAIEESLERRHYGQWNDQRAAHIEQISQYSSAKLHSLEASHAARLALLEDQRDNATHVNISRMRQGQIEAAIREFESRKRELENAKERADIVAEPVAFGVLTIRNK